MTSGIKIKLGKSARVKDGKIVIQPIYHDASAAIRAKKSKRARVVRRKPA